MDRKKIKRLVAKEGLILLGVSLCAFIISQNFYFQNWIAQTKIANPNLPAQILRERYGALELGEIIFRRAKTIGFLSILVAYSFIRFIIWAMRTLRKK